MAFNDQVQQATKIMSANIASAQAELMKARRAAENVRRQDLEDSFAGAVPVHGKFLVNGPGEAYKEIQFPVIFANVPVVTFGFEIKSRDNLVWTSYDPLTNAIEWTDEDNAPPGQPSGEASGLIRGQAPIITAAVYDWMVEENLPADQRYTGASVLTVCDGPPATKFIVHWTASGFAYSNPTGGAMSNQFKEKIDDQMLSIMVQWSPGHAGWYEGDWYRADQTPPGYGG